MLWLSGYSITTYVIQMNTELIYMHAFINKKYIFLSLAASLFGASLICGCASTASDISDAKQESVADASDSTGATDDAAKATDDVDANKDDADTADAASKTDEGSKKEAKAGVYELTADAVAKLKAMSDDERSTYIESLSDVQKLELISLPDAIDNDACRQALAGVDTFTVCDVDADGYDELVTCAENDLGESVQTVYDCSGSTLNTEVSIPYSLLFYTNGNMMALWPNNKGLNPDMMPFNMYTYDASTDTYTYAGYVDSWNYSYNETDYEGNDFPKELDEDEDGILYSIYYGDEYTYGYIHDGAELEKVKDEIFEGSDLIETTWTKLSSLFKKLS